MANHGQLDGPDDTHVGAAPGDAWLIAPKLFAVKPVAVKSENCHMLRFNGNTAAPVPQSDELTCLHTDGNAIGNVTGTEVGDPADTPHWIITPLGNFW